MSQICQTQVRTRLAPRTCSGTLGSGSAGACSNSAASALVASFFTPSPPALAPGFLGATKRGLAGALRGGGAPARALPSVSHNICLAHAKPLLFLGLSGPRMRQGTRPHATSFCVKACIPWCLPTESAKGKCANTRA